VTTTEERESNDVTITESYNEEDSTFVNILFDKLVAKSILDESTCSRILATYKVQGRNSATAQPYTKATIGTCQVKGVAEASKKFINSLTVLLDQHEKQGLGLVKYCMELVLDNDIMQASDAAQLAADNGYGCKIQTSRYSSSSDQLEVTVAQPTEEPTTPAPPPPPTTTKGTEKPPPPPTEEPPPASCECPTWQMN